MQGSSDKGRDIIATKEINEPLLNLSFEETWHIECKKYQKAKGVNLKDLSTHIFWADTNSPEHLLIITSSHLTKDLWEWIDENKGKKHYRIKAIERNQLIDLILSHQKIAYKYFIKDKYLSLIESLKEDWLIHNLTPSVDSIYLLSKGLKLETWSTENLLFLLAMAYVKREEIENWIEENNKPFSLDKIYFHICGIEGLTENNDFELGSGILIDEKQQHIGCHVFAAKSKFLDIHIYAKDYITINHWISDENPVISDRY